jgi:uncharacterized membrane protein YkoI
MNKLLLAALILALAALGYVVNKTMSDDDYGTRPVITDIAQHNDQMNACVKAALDLHPGAILETEVEMEDGKLITDVDIQGADGKKWEVECELATTAIVEDKQED